MPNILCKLLRLIYIINNDEKILYETARAKFD